MNSNKFGYAFAFSALGLIILYLLVQNTNSKKENEQLRDALNSNNLISDKIRQQLLELLEKHPHIDEDVKSELSQVAGLLGLQQEMPAILKLTKIIENLLKQLLKSDVEFSKWLSTKNKKSATFHDYLEFANQNAIITKEDFHLISSLKQMRNEEAHEMNVIKDRGKLIGSFIAGVSITIGLYNLVKAKAQKQLGHI